MPTTTVSRATEYSAIFAGLLSGPNQDWPESQNFHSTDPNHQTAQFRDLVEVAGLEGVYMTDLVDPILGFVAMQKTLNPVSLPRSTQWGSSLPSSAANS